ncbi:hypothetical protein HYH03_015430 [Edaphochlamys debaryana]|uniref:Triacylglycerol lipase n=1 Tax=Edaphochlamys debaryana TaxID=47281 RepID=A0A836BR80_9CHLO|nr:hypothetical protein HYH03_015430 [Edaphochlamys debaryana]|eukprot:KAG2485847.1 hypothetical protein HYH03_015430 [Edaphochlamys debaryana]
MSLALAEEPHQDPHVAFRADALDRVEQLVLPYGYPLQVHQVVTEDGFVLTLLRMPYGDDSSPTASRTALDAAAAPRTSSSRRRLHGLRGAGAAAAIKTTATLQTAAAASTASTSATARTTASARTQADSATRSSTTEDRSEPAAGRAGGSGAKPSDICQGWLERSHPGRTGAAQRSAGAGAASGSESGGVGAGAGAGGRPVVFLQHGLLDSAAGFLVNGPGRSLAFLLADQGYDVWLGNVRGNTLSRTHMALEPADVRFWQWSYDEMAQYDLPAMLTYAACTSGVASLSYLGHSQGTTVILAALAGSGGEAGAAPRPPSLPPGLVERAVLLAPVAVAKHITSVPLLAMATLNTDDMFSLLGLHEFLPSDALVAALEGGLCALQPYLCVSFLAALCGYNPDNLDNSRLPLYLSYTPAGTSVQNMAHWAQAVRARAPNSMRLFDFGPDCPNGRCNQLMYGSLQPPRYNLSAITTPLAIFSGLQDRMSTPLDLEYLRESLGAGVVRLATVLEAYEHLDFVWGIDAKEALYDDVMRFLAGPIGPNA